MRKISIVFLCVLLLMLPCPVSADTPLIVDDADILTDWEQENLEQKANTLSETMQMDVAIVTVESLNGQQSDAFAQQIYKDHMYGVGSTYDGILFLLSMEEREWAMVTCGNARYVFPDSQIDSIFSEISWYLSIDQYYDAFNDWMDVLASYYEAYYQEDAPGQYGDYVYYGPVIEYDTYYHESDFGYGFGTALVISVVIGVAVAAIALLIMRSKMNTAKPQRSASNYLQQNSYRLLQHRDIFLYSNVSKVPRQENNSGGHGHHGGGFHGGGGHGGGHSFGGGRGKF